MRKLKYLWLVTFLLMFAFPGCMCSAPERAKSVLQAAGYTNIQVGDVAYFRCGENDYYSNKFTATNQRGGKVKGVVCCGLCKGCTVRHLQ